MGQEPEPPKGLPGRREHAALRSVDSLHQALNFTLGIERSPSNLCALGSPARLLKGQVAGPTPVFLFTGSRAKLGTYLPAKCSEDKCFPSGSVLPQHPIYSRQAN